MMAPETYQTRAERQVMTTNPRLARAVAVLAAWDNYADEDLKPGKREKVCLDILEALTPATDDTQWCAFCGCEVFADETPCDAPECVLHDIAARLEAEETPDA